MLANYLAFPRPIAPGRKATFLMRLQVELDADYESLTYVAAPAWESTPFRTAHKGLLTPSATPLKLSRDLPPETDEHSCSTSNTRVTYDGLLMLLTPVATPVKRPIELPPTTTMTTTMAATTDDATDCIEITPTPWWLPASSSQYGNITT